MGRLDNKIRNYRKGGTMKTTNIYWIYLENLRRSGVVNMYGAVPYIMSEFHVSRSEATEILLGWMKNYKKEDYENE